jgi:hypothetical protein
MKQTNSKQITWRTLGLALLASLAVTVVAQTPTALPDARAVIRLRVKVVLGDATKARGLSRKRFFLIKGSLAENESLIQSFEQRLLVSRDCYYRGLGASEALIRWLKASDCESVYCREVEPKDVEGADAVPEFQLAVAAGEKEFGSRELARKWLTVNLSDQIRDGFYKRQQQDLVALIKQAEELTKVKVMSVMTDRNGTAYFTDLEPGTYIISNILATEIGDRASLWNFEIKVKPEDLATEKPILISNPGNKDPRYVRNIKFVSVEKTLPACPAR